MQLHEIKKEIISNRGEGNWNLIMGGLPVSLVMNSNPTISLSLEEDGIGSQLPEEHLDKLPKGRCSPFLLKVKLNGEVIDVVRILEVHDGRAYVPHPHRVCFDSDKNGPVLRISEYEESLGESFSETLGRLDSHCYYEYIKMMGVEVLAQDFGNRNYA